MHGLPMSVGDLVGIDGCLSGKVEDGLDREPGAWPEDPGDPGLGDRAVALEAGDAVAVESGVGVEVCLLYTSPSPRDS